MVAIGFALAAPGLGLAGPGIGLGSALAGASLGLMTAYVDQRWIYPALFGKDGGPKPGSLEGFQLSTTDPGSARWEVFGTRAWVPGHYLWTLGLEEVPAQGGGAGKGQRPTVGHIRVDAGIATCDGPIAGIQVLYGDERPFLSRDFNRALLTDHQWDVSESGGLLVIEAQEALVTEFASLLSANDFVILEGFSPLAINGGWRVSAVTARTGSVRARLELLPLAGQTPVTGIAGSPESPASIRRIDSGAAAHGIFPLLGVGTAGGWFMTRPYSLAALYGGSLIPAPPQIDVEEVARRWTVGSVYVFSGCNDPVWDGRYRLIALQHTPGDFGMAFQPLQSQPPWDTVLPGPTYMTMGTVAAPARIVRENSAQFNFADPTQSQATYIGSDTQLQDPTLAAYDAEAPAHRGIAHVSLTRWTLAPFGNVLPRVKAEVKARFGGETVPQAITRICARVAPPGTHDTTLLRRSQLLGYSVPGGMPRNQALQPLMMFFGIAVQDRGGVLTFLDERDLPVVAVATRHLNARPSGQATQVIGFDVKRIDEDDIPERVLVRFQDPTNEGNPGSEGDGLRAPGMRDRGGRDTLDVNLQHLVVWPNDAKRRAREIRNRVLLEAHGGRLTLGPGYMDILPGHCLTFRSNNFVHERAPAGTSIGLDTRLRDILPGTVIVEVQFADGQRAALVDNSNGAFEGFPAGVTTALNAIDYELGRIDLVMSADLDDEVQASITYQYERQWLMRVSKAKQLAHDQSMDLELVRTTRDGPLPPLPRDIPSNLGGVIALPASLYSIEVLDVPPIYQGLSTSPWLIFAGAANPGGTWRGATIYSSPTGTDRWTAVGLLQAQSPVGTVVSPALPSGAHAGVVDWETELVIDMPRGEVLQDATLDQVAQGVNWVLVGDELIAFLEAEATGATEWTLRGLVRGQRHTLRAMDQHTGAGERVVMLFGAGWQHGLLFEVPGAFAGINRTYHWRFVPGGSGINDVDTVTVLVQGNSSRPAAPIFEADDLQPIAAGLSIRWWQRSLSQTTLFGPSPLAAGEAELYHVVAFDQDQYASLVGGMTEEQAIAAATRRRWVVGGPGLGTLLLHRRQLTYATADITADLAVAGGTEIGIAVYQVGAGGHSERSEIQTFTP